MKVIARNILLVVVVALYFVGSIGFTVHHCCCHKLYHTSCCLLDGFHPYKITNCERTLTDLIDGKYKLVYKKSKHCGSFVYSMEHGKYNYTEKQAPPTLYLKLLQDFSDNRIILNINNPSIFEKSKEYLFYNHVFKRRWQEREVLCSFLI